MSEQSKLLVTLTNGVKRITFNRPARRNAADWETMADLLAAVQASATDETRVVVLTGAGDSFCAGADLQALLADGADAASQHDVTAKLRNIVNPTMLAMRALPQPIIARVHGHAVGVGCNYALAADIIVASEQALFSQIFAKIGLMPDGGGTHFLPRLVGYHRAFELMATGEIVNAEWALALGMINRVVPFAELDATVAALAAQLATGPAVAYANMKAALNRATQADLVAALEFEAVQQGECFRSADFAEGVAAFLQKRKAVFTGR